MADLAPERDPGTRFYAPRGARNGQQIQACQPCVDAIRLQRAQAKQDAARAWLTAHPDPLPSRW